MSARKELSEGAEGTLVGCLGLPVSSHQTCTFDHLSHPVGPCNFRVLTKPLQATELQTSLGNMLDPSPISFSHHEIVLVTFQCVSTLKKSST